MPTATSRVRERGFGHSELLAKTITTNLKLEYANGQSRQLSSKRQDRLRQLSNSFAVKNQRVVNQQTILLLDDVLTTGGLLIAAAKILKTAGVRHVNALVFTKQLQK